MEVLEIALKAASRWGFVIGARFWRRTRLGWHVTLVLTAVNGWRYSQAHL